FIALACIGTACAAEAPQQRPTEFAGAKCEPTLIFECESLCNNGDLGACEVAGLGYISGKSVSQDYDRAAVLLEPACQAKRPLGCGGMAKLGQVGKVELSPTEI